MAVILGPNDYDPWLSPEADSEQLRVLLEPYPAGALTAFPVSKAVNNVKNDDPALVEPVEP